MILYNMKGRIVKPPKIDKKILKEAKKDEKNVKKIVNKDSN